MATERVLTPEVWQPPVPNPDYSITHPPGAPPADKQVLLYNTDGTSNWGSTPSVVSTATHFVQRITTLMRNESDPIDLGPAAADPSNLEADVAPTHGTLNGLTTATVTYTPQSRVPRYPLQAEEDHFVLRDNTNGYLLFVFVTVTLAKPERTVLTVSNTGGPGNALGYYTLAPAAADAVFDNDYVSPQSSNVLVNALLTNNVDGYVMGKDENNSNTISGYDPVSAVKTDLQLDILAEWAEDPLGLANAVGATYDMDNERAYVAAPFRFGGPAYLYRYTTTPVETGQPVKALDLIRVQLFENDDLSDVLQYAFGDISWDPATKRMYLYDKEANPFGFVIAGTEQRKSATEWGMRFYPIGTLTAQRPGVNAQSALSYDAVGSQPLNILVSNIDVNGIRSRVADLFEADYIEYPDKPLLTNTGEIKDLAAWPVTVPLPP